METVFLSYTYSPHPDYEAEQEDLLKRVRAVLEAMNLRELNGEDLGGGALTAEVKRRIDRCDAFIALDMPHAFGDAGAPRGSQWVADEFTYASAKDKRLIRIIHQKLQVVGMHVGREYIAYQPAKQVDALMKLMRTLSLWLTQSGRPAKFVLQGDLIAQFDADKGHLCHYRLLNSPNESEWKPASVSKEAGAMYAFVQGFPDKHKVKIRLSMAGTVLESDYQDGFGHIGLQKAAP